MREIVWDTETTGLDPFTGDRLVEIGAVELINHVRTGREYHQYINPLRSMSEEVIRVHGLTEEFLADKPTFDEIVDEFLAFVGTDSKLVAHNASFDMKFLNFQLKELGKPEIGEDRLVDSLLIARKKFPGARVNLDELCRRFGVDNSNRTVHGAARAGRQRAFHGAEGGGRAGNSVRAERTRGNLRRAAGHAHRERRRALAGLRKAAGRTAPGACGLSREREVCRAQRHSRRRAVFRPPDRAIVLRGRAGNAASGAGGRARARAYRAD